MNRNDIHGWTWKLFGATIEFVFVRRSLSVIAIDRRNKPTWRIIDR